MAPPLTDSARSERFWPWVLVALSSQIGWGLYPVFARYLQTVSLVSGLSVLALGNGLVLVLLSRQLFPQLKLRFLQNRLVWVFAGAVVLRAVTFMLAARYALALYVQLVALSTPFLVVLLSSTVLRASIPRYTGLALLLSLFGSVLMLSNGTSVQSLFVLAPTLSDWFGMGLSLVSSFFLAVYMLLLRRSAQQQLPSETMFAVQLIAIMSVTTVVSLLVGEDWSQWGALGLADWGIFLLFALGVFMGANISNIVSIRHLGAPFVSSLLGLRLIFTLVGGALLLKEQLTTGWQVLGMVIVLVSVTWYVTARRD